MEAMSAIVTRSFRAYGHLCAQKPWEVMFLVITATVALATVGDLGEGAPLQQQQSDKQEYRGVDAIVMTALRCGAMLYTYHQFRLLHRQGSNYVLGIACLFLVFSSLVFACSVVQILGSPVSDLKDAMFFFLLVIDLSKITRLSSLALWSGSQQEAGDSIAEGLALLGPGLSLDTCVEALLVGAGSLSGVWRLEQICQFAVLSIVINYILLMTFLPACLSLVLQMSNGGHYQPPRHPTTVGHSPVWQLGYSVHCASAIMAEESGHNPVLQRVKVIMSAGLVLVHGINRFSLPAPVDSPLLHLRNTSHAAARPHLTVRLLNDGLEQVVVVMLVVVLLIKYAMFEGRGDLEQQLLRERQQQQQEKREQREHRQKLELEQQKKQQQPVLPVNQDDARQNLTGDVDQVHQPTADAAPAASVPVSTAGRTDSATQTQARDILGSASLSPDLSDHRIQQAARTIDECIDILNTKHGAKLLTDDELVEMVKRKHLKGKDLETTLQDAVRGVSVRRRVLAPHVVQPSALDSLPYQHYDYGKVVGVCCENVVGYIPVPVGIAGPLSIDGVKLMIPLATTEGCLVASTNRGCSALQQSEEHGIRSSVLEDGMTRAAVVKLPSIARSTELYHWVHEAANKDKLKVAFNSTSSFARMEDVYPVLAGWKLHLRFLASTGDAMGMNMVSKGVEAALKVLKELFPDMEVLSISGNLCTDKKPSAINWVLGRGKSVVCWAVVPGAVVRSVLKTTVTALVNCHVAKNLEGSALAGSIGGNNAHAANVVAALFIACGQDPAQVVGSSNCMTQLEACGQRGEDLLASVTMPSLEVGTVGGGTALPAQAACLNMLGVKGAHSCSPGQNAKQLAVIVAGAVLAGELSLMAALTAGHLVNSHMKHNRAKGGGEAAGAQQGGVANTSTTGAAPQAGPAPHSHSAGHEAPFEASAATDDVTTVAEANSDGHTRVCDSHSAAQGKHFSHNKINQEDTRLELLKKCDTEDIVTNTIVGVKSKSLLDTQINDNRDNLCNDATICSDALDSENVKKSQSVELQVTKQIHVAPSLCPGDHLVDSEDLASSPAPTSNTRHSPVQDSGAPCREPACLF